VFDPGVLPVTPRVLPAGDVPTGFGIRPGRPARVAELLLEVNSKQQRWTEATAAECLAWLRRQGLIGFDPAGGYCAPEG
jgi:hypothetical protein